MCAVGTKRRGLPGSLAGVLVGSLCFKGISMLRELVFSKCVALANQFVGFVEESRISGW